MDKLDGTPTQQLAMQIVDALIDAQLLEEGSRKDVTKKITLGNPTSDDWTIWIEMATARKGEVERDETQD